MNLRFDTDEEGNYRVRGLDTCPHLESGTCWWFAPRTGELEQRPGIRKDSVSRECEGKATYLEKQLWR